MVNRASTAEPGKNAAFDDGMVSASPRVLVVEDDRDVAGLVGRELRALGFTVDVMGFAEDALAAARETEYSLMVVDIGLPDRDGLELVREMRKRSIAAPILMVTARGKVEDKVSGLANGADDYLVKPFALSEFEARVRALLRRSSSQGVPELKLGRLRLDLPGHRAWLDEDPLELTAREFGLLEALALRADRVTSRAQLIEALCSWDEELTDNGLDIAIHRLRRKLEGSGTGVRTIRGLGYLLEETAGDGKHA